MMKTFFAIITILFTAALLLSGCPNFLVPGGESGTILISINGQDERTIMPSTILNDFVQYKLDFTAETDGNEDFSVTWEDGFGILELAVGEWEVTVTAFLEGENLGETVQLLEAAKSEPKSFTVNAGDNPPVNIELLPLEDGEGTFSWNINFNGSFVNAEMQIWRIGKGGNPDTLLGENTVVFINNSQPQGENLEKEFILDAGEYRVIFTLANNNETVKISEILHVYKNMESNFTYTFTDRHFPVALLNYIFSAWNGSVWDFTGAEIIAGHFLYLGIDGINVDNFNAVVGQFNTLCAEFGVPAVNLIGLKVLVDAALIGIASGNAEFLDAGNYEYRGQAQTAVTELAVNGTDINFEWIDFKTLTAEAGVYNLVIEFTEALPLIALPANEMVLIPAGTFTRGSPDSEPEHVINEILHQVTLSNSFYMGRYAVTQELYEAVMGINPSYYSSDPLVGDNQERRPVESVSWFDAVEFCNKLSELEGFTPAYNITNRIPESGYPITSAEVTINSNATGYRLPTEAQWEYACRAGTTTAFNWGTNQITSDQANFYAIGNLYNGSPAGVNRGATTEVGRFAANAWGLYDMHGNVLEWCWDLYGAYPSGSVSDPTGEVSGSSRVIRGGSWLDGGQYLRSAQRGYGDPWYGDSAYGFRLVRPHTDAPLSSITVSAHPVATTDVISGSINETLSVTAAVTQGAALNYQWYRNTSPSNNGGTAITGATSSSYALPSVLTRGTYYYYCVVSAAGGALQVRTNVTTVNVESPAIEMILIPAGTFTMGSPLNEPNRGDDEMQYQVTLTRSFYMSNYAVTQEQYEEVMQVNPSYFSSSPLSGDTQERRPVEQVSWYHAIAFCNRLSIIEGLTPVYSITGMSNTNPDAWLHSLVPTESNPAWNAVTADWDATGYRLPTEAQWEYACRAGTTTAFNWGTNQITSDQANFNATSTLYNGSPAGEYRERTTEVGRFAPNAWGLYDMHGNVWEWCWDVHGTYPSSPESDPTGAVSGSYRVYRGGGWNGRGLALRSARRYVNYPWYGDSYDGFRLVRPYTDDPLSSIIVSEHPVPTTNVITGNISESLSVTATVTQSATLNYQWYRNTNPSNNGGTPIAGATSASYELPAELTPETYYYYCVLSAAGGALPVHTNVAAVYVEYNISPVFGIEMSFIPAGTFTMGSPANEPNRGGGETQYQVTLSNGFYMGKYAVTQEQYEAVMGVNPSNFTTANGNPPLDDDIQGRRPVEMVNWYHAIAFCNRLSLLEGLTPVYSIEGIDNTDADAWLHSAVPIVTNAIWSVDVTADWGASGYRLPTEAQWEYACRAGTSTAFNWGTNQITSD
ncbi:MAG: formylglycine-generating enzyme family protein, partial [Treponema sp.]|nr:formylglycine-generating enzyme family protein [Treponema sp.]